MTGPQKEAYTYNQSDELLGVNGDHFASFTYSYDKNGNVIEETGKQGNDSKNREESGKQGWRYTYDDENRLIVAEQKINNKVVSKISYSYDPFGRRIQKKSYVPGESPFASTDHSCEKGSSVFPLALHEKTERYLYDGEDIIAIYDANVNIQMSFVHGPGVDEPLSVTYYKKQNQKKDKAELFSDPMVVRREEAGCGRATLFCSFYEIYTIWWSFTLVSGNYSLGYASAKVSLVIYFITGRYRCCLMNFLLTGNILF